MKIKKSYRLRLAPDEIIGHFGKVQLVRKHDGRHVLLGGEEDERLKVRQWCDRFAPFLEFVEAVQVVVVAA
jgi:hypothetical protein